MKERKRRPARKLANRVLQCGKAGTMALMRGLVLWLV